MSGMKERYVSVNDRYIKEADDPPGANPGVSFGAYSITNVNNPERFAQNYIYNNPREGVGRTY